MEDGCVQAFLDIKRKRAHRFVLYRIGARAALWRMRRAATPLEPPADAWRADDEGKKIIIVQKSAPTVRMRPRCGAARPLRAPTVA